MRFGRAEVDVLVRGSRTWLLQAPADASYSALHPADATRVAPWPYPAQTLFSCDQQAGDVMLVPEMWAHATMSDERSVGLTLHPDLGANEFSYGAWVRG